MKLALLTIRVALLALSFSLVFINAAEAQGQGANRAQSAPPPTVNFDDAAKAGSTATGDKANPIIKTGATNSAKATGSTKTADLAKAAEAAKAKAATVDPTKIPEAEQLVLKSRDITSFGPQWQVFSDYLTGPKGAEQMPLSLIIVDGVGTGLPFQDIRISLAGKAIAGIKDFKGQPLTLTKNLTGAIGPGDNLFTVQAYGPMGAKLKWKLVTRKIIATKVTPSSFGPTDKVVVEGRNFSDKPNGSQVYIGDKIATIVSAKSTTIEIKPPAGMLGGKANLVVVVGSRKSNALEVTIKGAPTVTAVSNISTAPGQPFTITGQGFSSTASDNQVMFGAYPAQITSCTPTSIECIVPLGLDSISPVWDLPIKVKTNGMDSTDPENVSKINIQLRVF